MTWAGDRRLALRRFVSESNAIEGIKREPNQVELDAHAQFLDAREIDVPMMEEFVAKIRGGPLRREVGQNVRVGPHVPPPGGLVIVGGLEQILEAVQEATMSPYAAHLAYESLHPFMDGNGRSGRVLWAWHMKREGQDPFALPFLHWAYYQAFEVLRDSVEASELRIEKLTRQKGEAEELLGRYGAGGSAAGLIPAIHNLAHRAEAAEDENKQLLAIRTDLMHVRERRKYWMDRCQELEAELERTGEGGRG